MKLFEIGIKSLATMTPDEIISTLAKSGLLKKYLGKGAFGVAFELPREQVLKVWYMDIGFEIFIDYCRARSENPYLLKVLSKPRRFTLTFKDVDEPDDKGFQDEMRFVRTELLKPVKSLSPLGYDLKNSQRSQKFLTQFAEAIEEGKRVKGDEETIKAFGLDPSKATPKFYQFIDAVSDILYELRHEKNQDLDLRLANIGMRGDQPVLLDPITGNELDSIPLANLDGLNIDDNWKPKLK